VRLLRVAAGAGIAAFGLVVLWAIGLAPVPEGVTRRLAAFEAVFPGRWTGAEVERIACPPLSGLRLYVVCTDGCDGIWKVIGVRGFRTLALVNLNRMPPEPTEEVRRRFNREIAKEALRLDPGGAVDMIGCYLELAGLHPELVLTDAALAAVETARTGPRPEEAMRSLADGLDEPDALSRLTVTETPQGFESTFLYWDTASVGRPVLQMDYRLGRNGVLLGVRVREWSPTDGTVSGSTPGRPPT